MRFSYATIALPTLEPRDAAAAVAAAGFRGIEWKVGEAPHAMGSPSEFFLQGNRATIPLETGAGTRARDIADEFALDVVGIAPYVQIGDTARLDRALELAVEAGAPQLRLQGPRFTKGGPSYSTLFAETLSFLGEAERRAADCGVRVVVEIHHNTIVSSASLAHRLIGNFDPRLVGVIYDVGNMVFEGYEDHRIGFDLLGPYVHHVHLKNGGVTRDASGRWRPTWTPLDDGVVRVDEFLALLRTMGYTGWISIEDLSTCRDPVETMSFNAEYLSRVAPEDWLARV